MVSLVSWSFAPGAVAYPSECALGLVRRIGMSLENINRSSNGIIMIPSLHKQFGLLNLAFEPWRKDASSRKDLRVYREIMRRPREMRRRDDE